MGFFFRIPVVLVRGAHVVKSAYGLHRMGAL